jgi:hypothetical protein
MLGHRSFNLLARIHNTDVHNTDVHNLLDYDDLVLVRRVGPLPR